MKTRILSALLTLLIILTLTSCEEEDSLPVISRKKEYAWICGMPDSTGYGTILFSPDAGITWERRGVGQAALQGVNLVDIWAVDEKTVWAVGDENTVVRSVDGGKSWSKVNVPDGNPAAGLMCISIYGKTNIWISGSPAVVYHSPDNGTTWKSLSSPKFPSSAAFQGICAISGSKIYVAGATGENERGLICRSYDGGNNWDSVSLAGDYNRHQWIGVSAFGHTIAIYGEKSHYTYSADGGVNWINDSLEVAGGSMGADINHLIMLSSGFWWAAMDMGHVVVTTDGGLNWSEQQTGQGGAFLLGLDAWSDQVAITTGQFTSWPPKAPIVRTTDRGITWQHVMDYPAFLTKVTFIKY